MQKSCGQNIKFVHPNEANNGMLFMKRADTCSGQREFPVRTSKNDTFLERNLRNRKTLIVSTRTIFIDRTKMSSSTLIEVFGHIVFSFTRGVTEHYNPEEPEFTAESFGYNPLESTGREWYYHPVDELIYQEYSDRVATSWDYLASRGLNVRVINACSLEEDDETREDHEDRAMAWKRLRPSALRTVWKSMYIGALISLLTATLLGTLYILISYLDYKTAHNCENHPENLIPIKVQWMRTTSDVFFCAFTYTWYFVLILFLFRPFQLMGIKRNLILVCFLVYCLDALYRVALQALGISHSKISALQQVPLNILFLSSVCLQVYVVTNHFCTRSRRQKLTLFFQMIVPGGFCLFVSFFVVHLIYPAYNKQNEEGKLLIAVFTPLIGVVVKPISRVCVQRLYNITHPGYSYVLLSPLYFGSAIMFRVLQAELPGDDLHSLLYVAIIGIIHGAAEVLERSTMVMIDHICHLLWKRTSAPWGSFRTPRRERLMADIAIMSMLSESTAIIATNGFSYLYQFIYLQDKSLLNFAIATSVQLVIEWFFTSVSLAIETRYQNIAVMAVWRRRWKRHILVGIVNTVPLALWATYNLLVIVHGRFPEVYQPCKIPFTLRQTS